MLAHVLPNFTKKEISILEPSVGDGAFIEAFASSHYLKNFKNISFTSVEKDITELEKARRKALRIKSKNAKFVFRGNNFLDWQSTSSGGYSLIVGNPPYVRRRYMHEDHVLICEKIHKSAELKAESIKNIWSAFLIRCVQLLSNEGIIAFVLPAELLQSNFTSTIRDFLLRQFQRVEIFTFNNLLFKSIGQDTILLIGYKTSADKGTYYVNIEDIEQLQNRTFKLQLNEMVQRTNTKWTHHILEPNEIELLDSLKKRFQKIDFYTGSKPGIVTAANQFFIVNTEKERKYELSAYCHPIIQKGIFVNGKVSFEKADLSSLIDSNRPSKFLDFSELKNGTIPSNVQKYLQLGIDDDIPSRYKCLKRDKWFVIPNISKPANAFFFKRCHAYPKLLKNEANVLVTDSAYEVNMREGYNVDDFIFSFYNSVTLIFSELSGRYYGGGVLELTPREFKNLPIPYVKLDTGAYREFKDKFRNKKSIQDILDENDLTILGDVYQIREEELLKLRLIRNKLVNKRLRKSNDSKHSNI